MQDTAGQGSAGQDTAGHDEVREIVAQLLEEPVGTIGEDTDLITLGLDSIAMMRLAGRWRRSGYDVAFADLVAAPTLAAWRVLLGGGPAARDENAGSAAEDRDGDAGDGEPFALAGMQHAYWVGRDPSQQLGGVGAHFYHEFDGPDVDPVRLERAVGALFARHDMLRARFDADGRQRIAPEPAGTALTVHDDRALSATAAQEAVLARRDRLSHRLLDVEQGEVFDVALTRMPGGRTRLHVNLDMLVADAVSFRTLLAELARLYDRPDEELPPIDYSYRRYLADRPTPDARHREWWGERVTTLPGPPELPVVGGPVGEHRILRRHHRLDGDALAALGRHARARAVTPAMALTACFGEVIAAWSATPRFLLNVPMFGREPLHPHVDRLVGDFTGSVLLEFDAGTPATFAERAAAVQERFRADAAHAAFTGVDVLRELSRDRGRQVIAPVVLTSALNLGELYTDEFRRCFGSPSWIVSQGPQVWLDAQLTEYDGGLLVNWDALDQAFPPGMLDAMFGAFTALVESLARGERWDSPVGSLLPDAATAVRSACNDTGDGVAGLLHERFFARAAAEPERVAVLGVGGTAITYGEVAASALRIAGALAAAGVAPGDAVAVSLPKGPGQVAAVLGVLAAGAAYVPVGVDQPPARRARIGATAGVRAVLGVPGTGDGRPDGVPLVDPMAPARAMTAPVLRTPDDPAYVLFTSGSTGEPKGVVVPHRAAFNTVDDLASRFGLGPDDRTLALSALDFDLSVFDLFAPLGSGGAVVVPDESGRRDAEGWRALCAAHGVSVLNCVPALLDMLLAAGGSGTAPDPDLAALRLVLLGGDWVGVDLPGRLSARAPGARFVALGGTTETAIHSTLCDLGAAGVVPEDWRSVPYGTPLRGVALRVVDELGHDRPDHVTGELWIGGAGVADGYRGDAERTARAFTEAGGRRWYRTGDLARYRPDGTVEFLGRADAQVKLRGHRIELGEIEAVLETHPGVRTAVAGLVAGPAARLVAAVVPERSLPVPGGLLAWSSGQLPAHMVPSSLTVLDDVPLTANGKVDRRRVRDGLAAVPQPDRAVGTPPRGPVETTVADAWSRLLEVETVHREDGFFALGGDSLVATRLLAQLRAAGLTGASIGALFTRPVLADFAAGLRPGAPAAAPAEFVPDPENRFAPFAPTDVQRAYWMGRTGAFALGGIGCHFYREYERAEDVDPGALGRAVDILVARHDALRTVFDDRGDQRVLPDPGRYRVPVVEGPDAFDRLRTGYDHRVFDPATWPLFTVALAREGGRTRIAIGIDNLVADALSVLTFHSELGTLLADPDAALPPSGPTFRDYLRHAAPDPVESAAARADWTDRLPDLPPPPQLPLRVDPSQVGPPRFTRRETHLPATDWEAITTRAREYGLTPSAVLLAAFGEVLGAWSARGDLTVNVTLFDRADVAPGVPGVIGDFTSLMLVSCRPGACWLDTARGVQGDLSRGLDHRSVSAVWVQRELGRLAGDPEFTVPVVFTSALGLGAGGPGTGELGARVHGISQTPQVWLDHQVTDAADGGVDLNWDAVEELFPAGVLDAMFAGYRRMLGHLAGGDWSEPVPDLLPEAQLAVRARVNDTAWTSPETILHHGFFVRARSRPHATALLCGTGAECRAVSYGELADRALRIAALLRDRGVRSGDLVTVVLPKGPDQVAALLGVLAAGAGYVPVGVDQPVTRRARIQALAGSVLTLVEEGGSDPTDVGIAVAHGHDPLPGPVDTDPGRTAYVIFTSGSTGEPKGVEVTHRAAANTIADITGRGGLGPADRVLAVSGYDFDLSVFDVFGLLGAGGALVLMEEDERRDARRWTQLVGEHRVTVWNSVPALLDMLLVVARGDSGALPLRLALLSGDWVAPDLPERLAAAAPACRFVALGGATEASIWSNAIELARVEPGWRSAPYGFPLRGQRFRVVDATGRDRPDWVPGELWIGGDGLAVGYRGAPEATERAFVVDAGERWYRTGDRGRYRPDGCLEFLGRNDEQVKLRGHRIELGEIENALAAAPGVGQAVAVVAGDGPSRRLLAAVVPRLPAAPDSRADPGPEPDAGPVLDTAAGETIEREARVAESALLTILDVPRPGGGAADVAGRGRVTERNRPVVAAWLDWLTRRDVLAPAPGGHVAGPRFTVAGVPPADADDLAGRAGRRLRERADDYRAILDGRSDAVVLLDDPVLAPERLADAEPGAGPALDGIAESIADRARRAGKPVEVVELDGRSGATAARILARLGPDRVRYTVLEDSATLRAAAARRAADTGHRVTVRASGPVLAADLLHRFDVVIAHNVAHRHRAPSRGPALAALLARPGGSLHLVERVLLSPLALLTATLLDGGYDGLDPARRAAGSPMLDGRRWAALLRGAGFGDVTDRTVPGAPLTVVQGTRPADAEDPDPRELRHRLVTVLPEPMVPDRVTVLPWLPLTGNGKVDRATVARLVAAVVADGDARDGGHPDGSQPDGASPDHRGGTAADPVGEAEEYVAAAWAELLGRPRVGRAESFFALGGDSLLATRFLEAARVRFGVAMPLRRLFAAPTVAEVAATLTADSGDVEEGAL